MQLWTACGVVIINDIDIQKSNELAYIYRNKTQGAGNCMKMKAWVSLMFLHHLLLYL